MKFSESQEARPFLIHKSNRRVSAREINFSASATVGAELAGLSARGAVDFESAVWPFASRENPARAASNKQGIQARDAFEMTGVNPIGITFSLFQKMNEHFVRNRQTFGRKAKARPIPFDQALRHKILDARAQSRSILFLDAF